MTLSEHDRRPWRPAVLASALAALAGALPARARADEAPAPAEDGRQDLSSRLDPRGWAWVSPQGAATREESPLARGAPLAGLGGIGLRAEAYLHLRWSGVTAAVSGRATAGEGQDLRPAAVVNELFWEGEALGQHLTLGQKVMGWDVGFAYRPLDVIQQEDRRELHPFALTGVPLAAWEWFGEETALTAVWANPLRGRAAAPRDDEAVALRLFRRLGPADAHLVGRYGDRNRLEAGAAAVAVVADGLELHGSVRWRQRDERLAVRAPAPDPPPGRAAVVIPLALEDTVALLAGLTWNPGWDLSITAEAFRDPAGSPAEEWRTLSALAGRQLALLGAPGVPPIAVMGDLAHELTAFDRPNPLPWSAVVHVARTFDRLTPALDLLVTPEDGGWVASATVAWQGERARLDAGARIFGGPPGSAYRLFPEWGMFHVAFQWAL